MCQLTCVDFLEWSATQIGFINYFFPFLQIFAPVLLKGVFPNELVKELSQHSGNCLPDDSKNLNKYPNHVSKCVN